MEFNARVQLQVLYFLFLRNTKSRSLECVAIRKSRNPSGDVARNLSDEIVPREQFFDRAFVTCRYKPIDIVGAEWRSKLPVILLQGFCMFSNTGFFPESSSNT